MNSYFIFVIDQHALTHKHTKTAHIGKKETHTHTERQFGILIVYFIDSSISIQCKLLALIMPPSPHIYTRSIATMATFICRFGSGYFIISQKYTTATDITTLIKVRLTCEIITVFYFYFCIISFDFT